MAQPFASGYWHVRPGSEDTFIARWTEFLQWTRDTHPGLVAATLLRDGDEPSHFVSFAEWRDTESRAAWKQSDGFMERFAPCRELCDEMRGADYDHVVTV